MIYCNCVVCQDGYDILQLETEHENYILFSKYFNSDLDERFRILDNMILSIYSFNRPSFVESIFNDLLQWSGGRDYSNVFKMTSMNDLGIYVYDTLIYDSFKRSVIESYQKKSFLKIDSCDSKRILFESCYDPDYIVDEEGEFAGYGECVLLSDYVAWYCRLSIYERIKLYYSLKNNTFEISDVVLYNNFYNFIKMDLEKNIGELPNSNDNIFEHFGFKYCCKC